MSKQENTDSQQEDHDMEEIPRLFTSDIARMMFGSGDDNNPLSESIELMESMVLDYITKLCVKAQMLADSNNRQISHHDFMFLVRNDPQKREKLLKQLDFYDEIHNLRKTKFKQIEEIAPIEKKYIWDSNKPQQHKK